MPVPVSQAWTVATYVLKQKFIGRKRYPLVLMLEPLFRCNLACAGCGKIQYPAHILKSELTPEQCFQAAEECGAPMVAIPGGEPLMHTRIGEIVAGLVERKKYVYMCTNGLLLKEKLHLFKPSKYFSFSVHMDGEPENHDFSVCREGGYAKALDGMRAAIAAGFRVTTNTTLFSSADPTSVRRFFDDMMAVGVEGMMVSPGYTYDKAPDQHSFLGRERSKRLFREILSNRKSSWKFNASPLFLEFLMGKRDFTCTPWGMPTYNLFGWQKPCYLLQDGYASSFQELMDSVEWANYGTESGNPKCANCMVHSGYEASGVNHTFGSLGGLVATGKAMFSMYRDPEVEKIQTQTGPADTIVNPVTEETLQGWTPAVVADDELEKAFDYRGDVTITRKDGTQVVGYIFDRQAGKSLTDSIVRVMPAAGGGGVDIPYAEIAGLVFSGRDPAAGKSWEAWVRKYWEKRAAGEKDFGLEPEPLDAE